MKHGIYLQLAKELCDEAKAFINATGGEREDFAEFKKMMRTRHAFSLIEELKFFVYDDDKQGIDSNLSAIAKAMEL